MTHTIKIHNVETGEVIERDMTKEEIVNLDAIRKQGDADEQAAADKAAARQAVYAKLGLTDDEIQAITN